MMGRKLNTSADAGGRAGAARARFDSHMDVCSRCCAGFCVTAETLWRAVTLAALRDHRDGTAGANKLADAVQSAPVVEGRPSEAQAAAEADWSADHPSAEETVTY